MNRRTRRAALYAIGMIAILASLNAHAHSHAGLYDWAIHHRLSGWQAMSWPAEIDVFLAVGELALYAAAVGRNEGIAPSGEQAEGGGLERGDEVGLAWAGADGVPVGEDRAVAVAEQVAAPGVAVDEAGEELEGGAGVVGEQPIVVAGSQDRSSSSMARLAWMARPTRGQRLIGRERDGRRRQLVKRAEEVAAIRGAALGAVLREVLPECGDAPVTGERLVKGEARQRETRMRRASG